MEIKRVPSSQGIIICLGVIGIGFILLVLGADPNTEGHYDFVNLLFSSLGVLGIAGGSLGCVLIFYSSRPDASRPVLQFLQNITREVVMPPVSTNVEEVPASPKSEIRVSVKEGNINRLGTFEGDSVSSSKSTPAEVQQSQKERIRDILNNRSLTPEEQATQIEALMKDYDRALKTEGIGTKEA